MVVWVARKGLGRGITEILSPKMFCLWTNTAMTQLCVVSYWPNHLKIVRNFPRNVLPVISIHTNWRLLSLFISSRDRARRLFPLPSPVPELNQPCPHVTIWASSSASLRAWPRERPPRPSSRRGQTSCRPSSLKKSSGSTMIMRSLRSSPSSTTKGQCSTTREPRGWALFR